MELLPNLFLEFILLSLLLMISLAISIHYYSNSIKILIKVLVSFIPCIFLYLIISKTDQIIEIIENLNF